MTIPERVYHDATLIDTQRLSSLQKELVDCLLTRNHDSFVRQKHLERIIGFRLIRFFKALAINGRAN